MSTYNNATVNSLLKGRLANLNFQDDIALMPEDAEGMQILREGLYEVVSKPGLSIKIAREQRKMEVSPQKPRQKSIESVNRRRRRSVLEYNSSVRKDVRLRIGEASGIFRNTDKIRTCSSKVSHTRERQTREDDSKGLYPNN